MALNSRDWHSQLSKARTRLGILETEINRYQPGSKEYNKLYKDYSTQKLLVIELQTKYDNAVTAEKNLDKVKTAGENLKSSKKELEALQTARKAAADLGQDTTVLDQKIATTQANIKTYEKIIKTTKTTPEGPQNYPEYGKSTLSGPTGPTGPGTPTGTKTGTSTSTATLPKDNKKKTPKVPTDAEERASALEMAAGADLALPATLFNHVPELQQLMNDYVNSDKQGGQWTLDTLRQKLRNTVWYRQNSAEIKARYIDLYNYQDMVKSGQAVGNTNYEKQIATLERKLADKARQMGSGLASDPAALRRAAENMYITNVGIDDAMTTDLIAAAIRPIGTMIGGQGATGYSGEALKNYQSLQSIAKANGFKLSDIVPGARTEAQVLQGIATGALDINRIAQDARKLAAQGQPDYVRDLLGQGYDLNQIYAPYQEIMAKVLEIDDPNSISLNDQTLRAAITDQGDMNIYDFKKLLKQDSRWQYTENARQEVASAAMKVLRDFGFQG